MRKHKYIFFAFKFIYVYIYNSQKLTLKGLEIKKEDYE